ncbi:hypothetical protein [Clostridium arbusti]|jgi:hypothetical protein|uniref:hypothetical protein n=1 Tax=Clostridium arbusti TaxID=1137848 RepID=UPI00028A3066|nr:hypothetical protein [Clostridium arbusti]
MEVVPFEELDINEVEIISNYLYYAKIIDKNNEGLLTYDYYSGEIYRISIESFKIDLKCYLRNT